MLIKNRISNSNQNYNYNMSFKGEKEIIKALKNKNPMVYFMELDSFNEGNMLPSQNDWVSFQELPKKQLNIFRALTSLSFKYPINRWNFYYGSKKAPEILSAFNKTINTDNVLSKKEKSNLLKKTRGHYPQALLEKYTEEEFSDKDILVDNLKFIKKLMDDDNKNIFKIMDPGTIVKILYNKYLPKDHFESTLKELKAYDIENYPDPEESKITLHEGLLGETYSKMKEKQIYDSPWWR